MEPARVLKRQDPSSTQGMATVDEESSTHLYRETEYFSGLPAGIMPSQEVVSSLHVRMSHSIFSLTHI